ncbi:PaaI family thioesterase [Nereida sp.]|uniref:PaaI family thioesterase n=1 Tax=Nereida sp. TaxID=2736090 RepID=UPI003F696B4F
MTDPLLTAAELTAFLARDFEQVKDDFTVDEITTQGIRLRLNVAERHLRPGGTVSGPAMFGLADVAAYLAILSRIGLEALTVTTNCSIDFMRKPIAGTDVICDVRLLKLGRRLAVCDALVFSDGDNRPVALASLTYSIPPKQ